MNILAEPFKIYCTYIKKKQKTPQYSFTAVWNLMEAMLRAC